MAGGCIWLFLRLGGGAAGFGGFLILAAPAWVTAAVRLVPALRERTRGWWRSLALGALFPFFLSSCFLPEYIGRKKFDAASWKAATPGWASEERIRQVDALIASRVLDRRNWAEVLDLLGPADRDRGGPMEWWYCLGPERGVLGIDSETFLVHFDPNGIVSHYFIYTD
jgi:hypothetical protein